MREEPLKKFDVTWHVFGSSMAKVVTRVLAATPEDVQYGMPQFHPDQSIDEIVEVP